MFAVTIADLTYRYRQFLIAVLGAGLVMAMAILLAGLAAGFGVEVIDTVGGVGASRWVLTSNSDGRITGASVFPEAALTAIAHEPGVGQAAPLVILPGQVARVNGRTETVVVIGVRRGALGDPVVNAGRALGGPGQLVADTRAGAAVGSTVTVGAQRFRVAGEVGDRTLLGGVPIVYMTLKDAQDLTLGGRPLVSAIVTQGIPSTAPAGLTVFTAQRVEHQTIQSLAAGASSINNLKFLMWAVAAIIIAALLYVSALQRTRDFSVLKALGSSSLLLLGSLVVQSVIVTFAAAAFAMIICNFMGGLFAQPVDIPASAFATLPLVAVIVGVLSSLVALRRATGADPAAAFG
jgi:putative ABC transport system permease protein